MYSDNFYDVVQLVIFITLAWLIYKNKLPFVDKEFTSNPHLRKTFLISSILVVLAKFFTLVSKIK